MKITPYGIGVIVAGMFAAASLGAGPSAAQTEALDGFDQASGVMATPARYMIGTQASYDQVSQRLAEQGFEVVEYELDDRRIEVKGRTATGHCMELKFHPVSGKETRRKRDDGCGPADQSAETRMGD